MLVISMKGGYISICQTSVWTWIIKLGHLVTLKVMKVANMWETQALEVEE